MSMQSQFPDVSRVEVISSHGRELVRYGVKNVQVLLQDEGKTLKIIFNDEDNEELEEAVKNEIIEKFNMDIEDLTEMKEELFKKISARYSEE